jgi:hypothetical protein
MSTSMTEKQRIALEALQAAQGEGKTLTDYARSRGLDVRELYDALAALRRKGALPRTARKQRNKFVAVRVATEAPPRGNGIAVCRIVSCEGYVIECAQWPPASWLASLTRRDAADAAT